MSQLTGSAYAKSQWRAILVCIFCTLAAWQFGYDSSYFSGILSMTPFIDHFGTFDAATGEYVLTASRESLVTSIIQVGEFIGAGTAWLVADKLGRKGGLYLTSACVIVGTTLQISTNTIGTLIAGRIVVGFAIGIISCLVPLYIADCAPARYRGALATMYQLSIGNGLLMGVIVDMKTSERTDTGSYRISMAMQYLFPLLLVPGLLFLMPESPRWLFEKNKSSQAERSLRKLKGPGKEDEIEAEMAYLQATSDSFEPSSWSSIWKNKVELRKAYLGFSIQALQQASGINFITGYGVVFFFNLDISNVYLIQIGLYTVGYPAIFISQYCIEKLGRRVFLIVSGVLMIISLFVMGGAGLATESKTSSAVIVSMCFIFLFVYNLAWGPTVWVVCSEISTGSNRGKLMTISAVSNWFFDWLVSFTFPYLDDSDAADLGAKVGFLYGALMIGACVWVFFYLPETAGRSLEEIHELFERKVPAREFQRYVLPSREEVIDEQLRENKGGVVTHAEVAEI